MGGNKNRGEKSGVALEPRTSQERPLFEKEGMSVGLSSSRVCKLKGWSSSYVIDAIWEHVLPIIGEHMRPSAPSCFS
jgi:hypothetical protein